MQNFPTVGLIDGTFRANLEETGMSYGLEVDMIAKAHAKDMLTTPYVFNADEAAAMAKAGADIIVCHMGLTTGGAIGAETALKLDDCPALVDAWAEAALKVRATSSCWCMAGRSRAGRRRIHPEEHRELPRLLRRLLDGAAAGGSGADRTDTEVQAIGRR